MLFGSIKGRLIFAYVLFFVLTLILLLGSGVLLLRSTLIRQNRQFQQNRMLEYWAVYQTGGIDLLMRELSLEHLAGEDRLYALRVANRYNETIFIYLPSRWNGQGLADAFASVPLQDGSIHSIAAAGNYSYELLDLGLGDGNTLQLATSTEDRWDILSGFTRANLLLALLLLIPAIIASAWAATWIVRPLKLLGASIRELKPSEFGTYPVTIQSRGGTTEEIEEMLGQFNAMGEKIAQLIQGFRQGLDNISHDLQTPLTRLMQRAELALSQNSDDASMLSQALHSCVEEVKIINGILAMNNEISRAENAIIPGRRQRTDLSSLISDLVDLYSYSSIEEEPRIFFRQQEAQIYADIHSDAIRQCLANLLDNALKYSPANSPIEVELSLDKTTAVMRVTDRGTGIEEQDLPYIWERLYRADKSRSLPGSGLGLALVKAVVEAHGGSVDVSSRLSQGSTFEIRLPASLQGEG